MYIMGFGEALELLEKGIYMRRQGWRGDVIQICLYKSDCPNELDFFESKSPEGKYQPWAKADNDLLAKDWYEPEEQIK